MGIKVQHTPIQAVGSGARLAGQAEAFKRKQDKAQQAALQARQLAAAADRQESQLIAAARRQQLQIAASAAIEKMRAEARKDYTPGKRPKDKVGDKTPSSWKYDSDDPFSPTYWEEGTGPYLSPQPPDAAPQERQDVMQQEKSFELPTYQEQYGALQGNLYEQMEIDLDALYASYFTDEGKFETAKARLEASYRQKDLKGYREIKAKEQEELQVQALSSQFGPGKKDMAPAQEIAARLHLGQEAEGLVFPEEKYISPQYLRSKGFMDTVKEYARSAEGTKKWDWGKKKSQSLVDRYQEWREEELYSTKGPRGQQQLDKEWDLMMLSDDNYNLWWENKKARKPITEVRALRATGRMADAMRDKVVSPPVTRLGKSLVKGKKSPIEKIYGTGAEVREQYGLGQRGIPQQSSRQNLLDEYKRLGGSQTAQGREFANKYLRS